MVDLWITFSEASMSQPFSQPSVNARADVVESFFGVYLLYSLNPKYKGRTYIGYTVNPNRRITQHNKGPTHGGARRTSNRGPWEMVLIVHGFPNDISALRFEWAWQNPKRSRRLRNVNRKKARENQYQYRLRILLEMLRMGPWKKLPLTVRWLAEQYQQDFQADLCPPMHMPIAMGPVCARKVTADSSVVSAEASQAMELSNCPLCSGNVSSEDALTCVVPHCGCITHITCLAKHFLRDTTDILPVEGHCPKCDTQTLWGDLVRKKKGCFKDLADS